MKKIAKSLIITMALAMALAMVPAVNTQAATEKTKSKVTYTLKKGTLTIKGKGKMPKKMTFKYNKKIKKVVIKKGVTSVSKYAFYGCKNLKEVKIAKTVKEIGWHSFEGTKIKKITIPKSVKTIGNQAFYNCNKLTTITMPGDFKLKMRQGDEEFFAIMNTDSIDTINFNTNFNINNAMYLEGNKWKVREKDPNYKSVDGVIYSKDGKELVRVPADVEELVVADGCETLCLQALFYGEYVLDDGVYVCCNDLKEITLPKTVKVVDNLKYKGVYEGEYPVELEKVIIKGHKLDTNSIITLYSTLKEKMYWGDSKFSMDIFGDSFDYIVKKEGDFYILDGDILLHYDGDKETVTVSEGIKEIGSRAFASNYVMDEEKLKKVVLPEGIEKIGKEAFVDCPNLKEINLPNGLKEIGERAFYFTGLTKIEIPETVNKLGKYIFEDSALKEAILPDNMAVIPKGIFKSCYDLKKVNVPKNLTTIKAEAFDSTRVDVKAFLANEKLVSIGSKAFNYTSWTNLVIPENIQTIGSKAFAPSNYETANKVTIEGKTNGIKADAFSAEEWADGTSDVTLIFKAGAKNYFTNLRASSLTTYKNKNNAVLEIDWTKVKGANGYDIRVCSDKKYKKVIKKVTVKKNKTSKTIKFNKKYKKVYVKIRPYKVVNGKKVYGRWSKDKI